MIFLFTNYSFILLTDLKIYSDKINILLVLDMDAENFSLHKALFSFIITSRQLEFGCCKYSYLCFYCESIFHKNVFTDSIKNTIHQSSN